MAKSPVAFGWQMLIFGWDFSSCKATYFMPYEPQVIASQKAK
jgi:hypothetical protein